MQQRGTSNDSGFVKYALMETAHPPRTVTVIDENRRPSGREVTVVDIPPMADCFDDEDVVGLVPRYDGSIVAGPELVVRIPSKLLEAMGGPVFRPVELLDQSLLSVVSRASNRSRAFGVHSTSVIDAQPVFHVILRHGLALLALFAALGEVFQRFSRELRRGIDGVSKGITNKFGLVRVAAFLPDLV